MAAEIHRVVGIVQTPAGTPEADVLMHVPHAPEAPLVATIDAQIRYSLNEANHDRLLHISANYVEERVLFIRNRSLNGVSMGI